MKIVFTGLGLVCWGWAIWNIYQLDVKKREHHISYETYREKTRQWIVVITVGIVLIGFFGI
ncbi:hypothetical protein MKC55_20565 [[Clostridium] innocuum]|nr:hypothetical protein [[Clostridium] innocuum]